MDEPMNPEETQLIEETSIQEPVRVGVIVCNCGKKIAGVLDTEALCKQAAGLSGVVYTHCEDYPCSRDGQARLAQAIRDHDLNRVLVAGCSPRLMRHLFRQVGQEAGLPHSFVNMANLREQVASLYCDHPEAASEVASDMIEMGVARLGVTSASRPRVGRVLQSVLVVGSDLGSLTLAQSLANSGVRVTVLKRSGGAEPELDNTRRYSPDQIAALGEAVTHHPLIDVRYHAELAEVTGHPGEYIATVKQGNNLAVINVGAIVVANQAKEKALEELSWIDRSLVKTQAEFENELNAAEESGQALELNDIAMILCAEETQRENCSRFCCQSGIRQALRARRLNPEANITILFRDLYLGGAGREMEQILTQARDQKITFFRYRKDLPPVIGSEVIEILDELTHEPVRLKFDRVVLSMPLVPDERANSLASVLGLPQDEDGFLAEPRVRLRPGRFAPSGIYVLSSGQQPTNAGEALLHAYLSSARLARFFQQEEIHLESPAASIDPSLCTGCGNCVQVCPRSAIALESRDGILSLSEVDALRCFGCGNCVVVCPSKAISLPGWDSIEIPVQISATLAGSGAGLPGAREPTAPDGKIIVLACEWSAYSSADLAGSRHIPYPENVRVIRTNCSARFDPYHILWAFLNGAQGVFLGICSDGECHYGSGNLFARERKAALQHELAQHGIDPRRLRLETLSVDDGPRFARLMADFARELTELKTEIAWPQTELGRSLK